jgi:Domain of Unknown Function (DUF928)
MYFKKSFLYSIPVSIVLALELAIAGAAARQIASSTASIAHPQLLVSKLKQSNPPPPPDNPDSSAAGGRRDPTSCPQDAIVLKTNPLLTALSPTTKPGLTLAERPTFLVYVPKTSAQSAEFSLRSRDGRGVYRTTVALTKTPNIISISLPTQAASLEVAKQYTWSFAIICNPNDRVEDKFVMGTVQRTELDPTRLAKIQQTPANQRLALYQEYGIWYDAIALLFELKRTQSNDLSLGKAWREFLQSGGIDMTIDSN